MILNESIRAREVRLIDADGKQVGVVSKNEALRQASDAGLDLVLISPNAKPPVAKIL
ncbi:MAG: translation initiation factor IF-3, partial [Lactobacillus delbrueckii]|nr:translation initiation factor IF-3 [Lactobacillus delbrueckii]